MPPKPRSPKKQRTPPKATTPAPVVSPRQSQELMSRASTPSDTSEGPIEHTEAMQKWLWAEDADDLVPQWITVELRHHRQAQALADVLAEPDGKNISSCVRNLRIHSALQDPVLWHPPLTLDDVLGDGVKGVASTLTKAGKLQCLAIDFTLVSEGWLADSAARPTRVIFLEDSATPGRPIGLSTHPKVFGMATHVVFEPLWERLRHALPNIRGLFPAMQYCCIQVHAASDAKEAEEFVLQLLRLRRLEKLVVCIWAGVSGYCSPDAPVWTALKKLSTTEEKLCVLPHGCLLGPEWQAMMGGRSTVFDITAGEMQEKLAAVSRRPTDECYQVLLDQEQQQSRGLDTMLFCREATPLIAREGSPWAEIAPENFDDITVPGIPSAEDELWDMMMR